jgi:hypothetical protein
MVLRFPSCSPRRPGFVVSVARAMRKHCHQLDISVGTSGPHDFAVRAGIARPATPARPPHSHPTFRDGREASLLFGCETGRGPKGDLPDGARGNLKRWEEYGSNGRPQPTHTFSIIVRPDCCSLGTLCAKLPCGLACDWRTCEASDLPKFPVPWDVRPWIFGDSFIWLSRSS